MFIYDLPTKQKIMDFAYLNEGDKFAVIDWMYHVEDENEIEEYLYENYAFSIESWEYDD